MKLGIWWRRLTEVGVSVVCGQAKAKARAGWREVVGGVAGEGVVLVTLLEVRWGVGWGSLWWWREIVELVEGVAAVGVEEVDGVLDEGGWVGAGEVDDGVGRAGAEDLRGDLGREEGVDEVLERDFVDCVEGVETGGGI